MMQKISHTLLDTMLSHYGFSKFLIKDKPLYFGIQLPSMPVDEVKALKTSLNNHGLSQIHADMDEIKISKHLPLTKIEDTFAAIFSLRPRWVAPTKKSPIPANTASLPPLTEATLKILFERHGFREPNIQVVDDHFQIQTWNVNPHMMKKFRKCLNHHGIQELFLLDEGSELVITIPQETQYHILESVFEEFNE